MRITVYLTGGIADYKAVEVIRKLEKENHEVRVVMTKNAEQFITSHTLAALTKYPVLDDLWKRENESSIPHVHLARWTQLALVVPASADFMAKVANGIADDAATTTLLATGAPKLVVPAMNDQMWDNPATQRNIVQLKQDGIQIMEPVVGMLAEGYSAKGRMPEVDDIVNWVNQQIMSNKALFGKKVIITAGGTIEAIDPVRYIGNRSSGKMGIAIAEAFSNAGADVSLIYGNISISLPQNPNINLIHVESSEDMLQAVKEKFKDGDILVMAAAVADWRMEKVSDHKLKKQQNTDSLDLHLVKTKDILKEVGRSKKENQIVMGFAAETNDLIENATKKLQEKGADYIVANDVSKDVFGNDQDQVTILKKEGEKETWSRMSKVEIANKLVKMIKNAL